MFYKAIGTLLNRATVGLLGKEWPMEVRIALVAAATVLLITSACESGDNDASTSGQKAAVSAQGPIAATESNLAMGDSGEGCEDSGFQANVIGTISRDTPSSEWSEPTYVGKGMSFNLIGDEVHMSSMDANAPDTLCRVVAVMANGERSDLELDILVFFEKYNSDKIVGVTAWGYSSQP